VLYSAAKIFFEVEEMANYLIIAFLVFFSFLFFWLYLGQKKMLEELKNSQESMKEEFKNNQALLLMQQQMGQLIEQVTQQFQVISTQMNQQLKNMSMDLNTRLERTTQVVTKVHEGLGKVSEATKHIFELGKDISSLQEILRAPKFRGGLGEFLLENLLSQILPPKFYQLQYAFKNGERVDAIIHLGEGKVPVDSKFPLESFKRVIACENEEERRKARREFERDVKKHIDDIARKYIREEEGTYNFALMYIPAENVYYEAILKDDSFGEDGSLFSYSLERKVIPVSPNSFYAYLQAIALGLKGLTIEEKAGEILAQLSMVEGDFFKFKSDFEILGSHLENARKKFEQADKKLARLEDRVVNAVQLKEGEKNPSLTS
jgi:DNA recombination protein RmuC